MDGHQDKVIQFKRNRSGIIAGVLVLLIVVAVVILMTCFHINSIEVTGNKHYSEEQIKDYVLSNGYVDNTVLLMLKNKLQPPKDIPFIAKLDIEYVDAHKVVVTVYEKAMAGCVEYMNQYVYFDQDGYVLEMSLTKLSDTPCITGMSFSSMELHEKLPIDDEKRFKLILSLTQLISKYQLNVDSIRFTTEGEVLLYYADIRIELGDGSKLEEQLVDLGRMLDGLEGKKGTLYLQDFDVATKRASFKLDDGSSTVRTGGGNTEDKGDQGDDGSPDEASTEDTGGDDG